MTRTKYTTEKRIQLKAAKVLKRTVKERRHDTNKEQRLFLEQAHGYNRLIQAVKELERYDFKSPTDPTMELK
jgi:hypothetical protein